MKDYFTGVDKWFDDNTLTVSNSVIIMLAKVGPSGEPIETPSVCLQYSPLIVRKQF